VSCLHNKWNFDEHGRPYLDNECKATIIISSSETNTQQTIPHLYNYVSIQYLGVSSAPNGNQNIQFQVSFNIVKKAVKILFSTTFYHTQAKLCIKEYVNQKLYYPFPQCIIFFQTIYENQQGIYTTSHILHGI